MCFQYDNFIDLNFKTMEPIVDFSGSKLLVGETDGSSFPNGGLRVTHTAAAYTAWCVSLCFGTWICLMGL